MSVEPAPRGAKPAQQVVDRRELTATCTMGELIVRCIRRFADRVAFATQDGSVTYRELGTLTGRALGALTAMGLPAGSPVAQRTSNRPEAFALQTAAYLAGHPSLMVHPKTSDGDLRSILDDAGAGLLVVDPDQPPEAGGLRVLAHGAAYSVDHFWALPGGEAPLEARPAADDLARLSYTGGTTGRPKGVMLSHRAMVAATLLAAAEMEWPDQLRFLVVSPISHAGGTLVPTVLLRGGTVLLRDRFDLETVLDVVRRERITSTFMVPTMITRLLDRLGGRPADVPSLEMLLYGGSPISPDRLTSALAAFGPVLVQSYGQAEAPNTIAVLKRSEHRADRPDLLRSCGLPYAGVRVSIRDEAGREVAAGAVGEVCVRGPQVMDGYLGLPDETAAALRDGWLHTGDVGYLGPEGHLFLVARSRDVIVTGGFNVYPREIEEVLSGHPGVRDCVVVGAPDETWGEAVTAVVVRRDHDLSADELSAMIREQKGPLHVPKRIEFVDALPVTALGKPDRARVRAGFWAGSERLIH